MRGKDHAGVFITVSKLLEVHPKNVIVTGSQGADISRVSLLLEQQGWLVSYPGQDLDVFDGARYKRWGFNVEVDRIHQALDGDNTANFSDNLPDYYDIPYPGPREYIAQFEGRAAVISSYCIAPRLDMWKAVSDIVVEVKASQEEDKKSYLSYKVPESLIETIRDYQLNKLSTHLKLFPKVFTITNAEVKDGRFDVLSNFLNSVF